ncbi:hypothetical protein SAFG77S_04448 [Streptomyces afghaniensis]
MLVAFEHPPFGIARRRRCRRGGGAPPPDAGALTRMPLDFDGTPRSSRQPPLFAAQHVSPEHSVTNWWTLLDHKALTSRTLPVSMPATRIRPGRAPELGFYQGQDQDDGKGDCAVVTFDRPRRSAPTRA